MSDETYELNDNGLERLLEITSTPKPQTQSFTRRQIVGMIARCDMQIIDSTEQKALWETRLVEIDK